MSANIDSTRALALRSNAICFHKCLSLCVFRLVKPEIMTLVLCYPLCSPSWMSLLMYFFLHSLHLAHYWSRPGILFQMLSLRLAPPEATEIERQLKLKLCWTLAIIPFGALISIKVFANLSLIKHISHGLQCVDWTYRSSTSPITCNVQTELTNIQVH